jgi:hypothetical protein
MQLPGRLGLATLGDLLGRLHRERATGTLELVEAKGPSAGRRHRVHWEGGLVSGVETQLGVPRIGDILQSQGFVGDETLRKLARRITELPGRLAGDLLVEEGRVSRQVVSAAVRRQVRLKLDALFSICDAFVRFHVVSQRGASVPLSPREFLHGRPRARAADEQKKQATNDRARRAAEARRDRARSEALAILGLGPDANREAVQRAFRKLASVAHPDRHPTAGSAEKAALMRRFAEISQAYHLLVA